MIRTARPPRSVLVTALVATLVTVGMLVTAFALRPDGRSARTQLGVSGEVRASTRPGCGDEPCRVFDSAEVGGRRIELLADSDGGSGRLRAGGPASGIVAETAITGMGVRLNSDSLRCEGAEEPVCLVRGPLDGGMVGEVQVWRSGSWRAAERPYFSDAGAVTLDDVAGDAVPEVVVVRHECSSSSSDCQQEPVLAEVFDLSGAQLGCTYQYSSPGELSGWPEVRLDEEDLRECQ